MRKNNSWCEIMEAIYSDLIYYKTLNILFPGEYPCYESGGGLDNSL
jgi:hypothetical protein